MALSLPAAISVVGDALQVRHLRAAAKSWVVWTFNDDGGGERFAVRERTGSVAPLGGLQTDGTDFSERVIPVPATRVRNFHCLETAPNIVTVLFDDGLQLKYFVWNVNTNVVVTPVTVLSDGTIPSQFDYNTSLRQLYVRLSQVRMRANFGPEITLVAPSGSEVGDMDIVRLGLTPAGRYAGAHAIRRELALPFLSEASTTICYNKDEDFVSVTEALPAGTVGYFTFDDADYSGSTILNQAGAFNGTLVSTAPTSLSGQVNQARSFVTGGGYYDLGNPAALQITGDLSVAFWIRANSFTNRVSPYGKAFGGEGTITLETDGALNFSYGTAGNDSNPNRSYPSLERLPLNRFVHVGLVRDTTNRMIRWFFDGKLINQVSSWVAAATASSLTARIGRSFTSFNLDARLDELLIANQAFTPQTMAALYAKGLSGAKADTSATGQSRQLLDIGPGGRHATLGSPAITTAQGIALGPAREGQLLAGMSDYATSATLTIEARLYWRGAGLLEMPLFSNRDNANSSGTRLQGTIEFSYTPDGYLRFRFETTTATVELQQTGGVRLRPHEMNVIAVSHTFGAGGASILVVNGTPVPAQWVGGGGDESPTLLAARPAIRVGPGDELGGLRVSNVAKTITQLREYLRGRA